MLGTLAGCGDFGTEPSVPSPTPSPVQTDTVVSFSADVRPIFANQKIGCLGCHGGQNNLFVGTPADLLRGGFHGPAIVPGNSAASLIIQKMSPNPPFGARMPFGGNPVPDSLVQIIKNWIDQGAHDN
jgi:hypothetical protein